MVTTSPTARMPSTRAVVVGGGIAGLAAASSLLEQGWRVTVLERGRSFGEVGAGIGLTANGLAALDALDLGDDARAAGHQVHVDGTVDHRGRSILRLPRETREAPHRALVGIHRQRLHRLLLDDARGARLVEGARVTEVDPGRADGETATVICATDGGTEAHEADLVVGADGLRSVVRSALVPSAEVRYSGWSCWRGIVDDEHLVGDDFTIRWGPGAEFGALRVSAHEVYWYGYAALPAGSRISDEKAAALARFDGWADPVLPLVAQTPVERVMRHDVHVVAPRLRSYVGGRVVLVGDAAHAMLPTMGQGANTSLEDGVCVGRIVAQAVGGGVPLGEALARFDAVRRPRTQAIARRSALTARFGAHMEGHFAITLRNAALRAAPVGRVAAAGDVALLWTAP